MPAKLDLRPAFRAVQPQEAIDYFRQKGYRIGFDYRDVWQQEHQAAFTVAKGMQIDLLADVRSQVEAALVNGTTFATFKKALKPGLVDRGWWGKKDQVDPIDGETKRVQLGSPKRLRVIFDANLATAYSEGQWERIQRNKGLFGFLEYVRSGSVHPRQSHLAYVGLVLPVDDPFWRAHLPVREWGCKCTVIQHTYRTLERDGLKVGQAPAEQLRTVINKRTGEEMQVPIGVDPAFNYPPGGRRANLGKLMMDKADAAGAVTVAKLLQGGVEQWAPLVKTEFSEFVGRYAHGERREVGNRRVVGVFTPQLLDGLKAAGVQPAKATIAVNLQKLRHLLGEGRSDKRKAKGAGVDFVASLPELLQHIGEAWLDGSRVVLLCTSPDETERVAKVVIDLDEPLQQQRSNSVVSMDLIKPVSFARKGLVRLDGKKEALR
jgi:hypothetical protein